MLASRDEACVERRRAVRVMDADVGVDVGVEVLVVGIRVSLGGECIDAPGSVLKK